MTGQAREIVLDGEIAVSDDRSVTHIEAAGRVWRVLPIASPLAGRKRPANPVA
jgi:hypothetical protein